MVVETRRHIALGYHFAAFSILERIVVVETLRLLKWFVRFIIAFSILERIVVVETLPPTRWATRCALPTFSILERIVVVETRCPVCRYR